VLAPPKPPPDELELLIREARERQLRRRLIGAAGLAVPAALGLSIYALTIGGATVERVTQAHAGRALAPLCRSSQLSGSASFQGATQSMLGGITLHNTSRVACSLPDARPAARLSWDGHRLPTRELPMATATVSTVMSPAHVLGPGQGPRRSSAIRSAMDTQPSPRATPPRRARAPRPRRPRVVAADRACSSHTRRGRRAPSCR
jgi:hypothetical protein